MATGPLSYVQYMQMVNAPIVRDICMSFIKHRAIFTHFKINTLGEQRFKTKRVIGGLPTPTFLQIGQEPTNPFVQNLEDYEESYALIRDNFDYDRIYANDKNYVQPGRPFAVQIDSYIEGRAFALNNYLINNNHVYGSPGDANGFIGLKYRLQNPSFVGNNAGCYYQSTASLADAGLSVTNATKMLRDFDVIFDHMGADNGDGVIALANPQVCRQLTALIRFSSPAAGFEITRDVFNRELIKYKGCSIVNVGYNAPTQAGVQSTPIITSTQDVNGHDSGDPGYNASGANYSSIYFVKEGEEDFQVWQPDDPWMEKERVSGTRKWRIMFDMGVGIAQPNTRAIAAIYGILTNGSAQD